MVVHGFSIAGNRYFKMLLFSPVVNALWKVMLRIFASEFILMHRRDAEVHRHGILDHIRDEIECIVISTYDAHLFDEECIIPFKCYSESAKPDFRVDDPPLISRLTGFVVRAVPGSDEPAEVLDF